ncbi:MAG: hypothetical protein EBY80_13225 [Actinobacteria bacterium]|jgi:hypothetical protein|nr:hypothetical protein [Actinomycetota bacterium]
MAELDDLFGGLDNTLDFLNEKKTVSSDGIYRIDLSKAKDKKRGYKSVIRLLPNLTKEGKVGMSALEKITHYVNIKNPKELAGWFDSPKNFGEKCPLTDLYYNMVNSKNAILVEKAKQLNYSKKYYSYALVIEDEQQPELVGKIMIFQYGKIIRDKILAEKNGEISGVSCNVFDLANGKDFVLLVKEIQTGEETYPDYKNSMFRPETSAITLYNEERREFKQVPVQDGKVDPRAQKAVRDFLLKRDHDLEEFAAKPLTEEQQVKISEISNFLTGKASTSFAGASAPSSNDFDFDEVVTKVESGSSMVSSSADDDDFFKDF